MLSADVPIKRLCFGNLNNHVEVSRTEFRDSHDFTIILKVDDKFINNKPRKIRRREIVLGNAGTHIDRGTEGSTGQASQNDPDTQIKKRNKLISERMMIIKYMSTY